MQYMKGKERILRWMDFRGRFGFSEYNSDTYAPIAFNPLVTVAGIGPDDDIRDLATIIVYLQLFDWVLGSHQGDVSTFSVCLYNLIILTIFQNFSFNFKTNLF